MKKSRIMYAKDWKAVQIMGSAIVEEAGLILRRKGQYHRKVMGERIAVLHLAQANELLMKAFLMKKGYVVDYVKENDVRAGMRTEDVEEKSLTLTYAESLKLVLSHLLQDGMIDEAERKRHTNEMIAFYKIRNEIQHSAMDKELEKLPALKKFYPYMKDLHNLMFPREYFYDIPELER